MKNTLVACMQINHVLFMQISHVRQSEIDGNIEDAGEQTN